MIPEEGCEERHVLIHRKQSSLPLLLIVYFIHLSSELMILLLRTLKIGTFAFLDFLFRTLKLDTFAFLDFLFRTLKLGTFAFLDFF